MCLGRWATQPTRRLFAASFSSTRKGVSHFQSQICWDGWQMSVVIKGHGYFEQVKASECVLGVSCVCPHCHTYTCTCMTIMDLGDDYFLCIFSHLFMHTIWIGFLDIGIS